VADGLPDFSPAALSRLVAGMTTDEVEAIVGRFHRPNMHDGREYWAWIGEGGMLRAFFKGPDKTLTAAVLDVPEEQRRLDLGPDARRRLRQATIMQTWYCVPCRQRYRQPQTGRAVVCPACGGPCERPSLGIRVPAPRYVKAWDRFWPQYRAEAALLDAYGRGEELGPLRLELLGLTLPRRRRTRRCT
jgi:DNA-directed RNA polymerase subunit RPC12/RpoP